MSVAIDPAALVSPPGAAARVTVSARVALLSIVGFWLFYFATATLRGLAFGFESQTDLLVPRAGVTIAGFGITCLLCLLLRALPGATMRGAVAAAALLAVPAALAYATVNWFAFLDIDANLAKQGRTIIIREPGATPLPEPPLRGGRPPAPPRVPLPGSTVIQIGDTPHEEMSATATIADAFLNGYFFIVAWAAFYLALCYAAGAREAERRAAAFRAAAQAAELRALRYQVNPHFLFNTLNSLSSLVLVDRRDEAERMILNLSTFFRTSLTADPAEDLPLAEEIRLQRLYLDIEQVRFPDRLRVAVEIPAALQDACVPALILQPLVENAIKYGVSRSREPVTIRICAREDSIGLVLTVADDGTPLPAAAAAAGTGLGLRNVRERLAARFGDAAGCRWGPQPEGGFLVMLTMPLVRRGC